MARPRLDHCLIVRVARDTHYDALTLRVWASGCDYTIETKSGCGVPLDLNMAGQCEHCTAHVTSGEFDWVLSKIEQDESYVG